MSVGQKLREIHCKEYTSMTNVLEAVIYDLCLNCLIQIMVGRAAWVMTDEAEWSFKGRIINILSETVNS